MCGIWLILKLLARGGAAQKQSARDRCYRKPDRLVYNVALLST